MSVLFDITYCRQVFDKQLELMSNGPESPADPDPYLIQYILLLFFKFY